MCIIIHLACHLHPVWRIRIQRLSDFKPRFSNTSTFSLSADEWNSIIIIIIIHLFDLCLMYREKRDLAFSPFPPQQQQQHEKTEKKTKKKKRREGKSFYCSTRVSAGGGRRGGPVHVYRHLEAVEWLNWQPKHLDISFLAGLLYSILKSTSRISILPGFLERIQ